MVARGEPMAPAGSADLSGLLTAAWEVQPGGENVHVWYLGALAVLLAVAGWRRGTRPAALVVAGLLLGLGPVLRWDAVDPASWSVPGPWAIVGRLPGLAGLHIEYRFVALAALGVGLLAASGIDELTGRLGRGRRLAAGFLALGVTVDLLIRGGAPALLRWGPTPLEPTACTALAGLPDGPVLDLPGTLDERWLLAQTCHGRPVAAGFNRPWSGRTAHALARPPAQAAKALGNLGHRFVAIHDVEAPADLGGERDAWAAAVRSGALPVAAREDGVAVVDLARCPDAPGDHGDPEQTSTPER
jgi:hypothetical protein